MSEKIAYNTRLSLTAAKILRFIMPSVDKPPQQMRKELNLTTWVFNLLPPVVAKIENMKIPVSHGQIPVRIYTPNEDRELPVIIFFHGGGWVKGNLDTYDKICRLLANKSSAIVVSVSYRLAPEHKFPTAVVDAFESLKWISENAGSLNGDASRIAVAGDSAGGNLATVVSQIARDKKGPKVICQVLICPVTDFSNMETGSYLKFAQGYFLTRDLMKMYRKCYLSEDEDRLNPLASPLLAEDLRNLPPAIVVTASLDVLRDEGFAYVERLTEAGVPVKHIHFDGVFHGFVHLQNFFWQGRDALDQVCRELKKVFN